MMELGGLLDEFERYAKNSYIANIKLGVPDIRDFLQEFSLVVPFSFVA